MSEIVPDTASELTEPDGTHMGTSTSTPLTVAEGQKAAFTVEAVHNMHVFPARGVLKGEEVVVLVADDDHGHAGPIAIVCLDDWANSGDLRSGLEDQPVAEGQEPATNDWILNEFPWDPPSHRQQPALGDILRAMGVTPPDDAADPHTD